MSLFDPVRNKIRAEEAKKRVLDRTYSPKSLEVEKEDMFDAVRKRITEQAANPTVAAPVVTSNSNKGTPMADLMKQTGDMIDMDPRNSELMKAVRNEPMAVQKYKNETGITVGAPKTESTKDKIFDSINGFNAFTDRLMSATTLGGTKLVDQLFTKIGPKSAREYTQEKLDRAENVKGGVVADVLGSLVSGSGSYKAAGAVVDPLIGKLPKLAQTLLRGTAAGTAFEVPRQTFEEVGERFGGAEQSMNQRLKNVGVSAALGGLTDLGIGAGGAASSRITNPLISKVVGGGIGVGSLGAALGTANEFQQAASGQQQSLGGRIGDIAKYAATGAGIGMLGGTAISKLMKKNGVPEEQIAEILALPEGKGTVRQTNAANRSNVPYGTDPIINPSDFKAEPLALQQGEVISPTVAKRRPTETNIYRQKFENLIAEAKKRTFSPGREDIELENLWGQMAERNDPGLDELVSLAYPKRTTPTPQRGMIDNARNYQMARDVYGIGNPVKSNAELYPSQVLGQAAAPRTIAGRVGGTPRAEINESTVRSITEPPVKRVDQTFNEPVSQVRNESVRGNYQRLLDETTESSTPKSVQERPRTPEETETLRQDLINRFEELERNSSYKTEDLPWAKNVFEPEVAPTKETVSADKQTQDLFTDLFGEQGLGIVSGGSTRGGIVSTADQIVSRAIKNDKEGIKEAVKAQLRSVHQNNVDALSPLKKIGDEAYDTAMDSTRANNIANVIVNDKFVNMEGQVVGDSLKDIFTKVARGQDKNFLDFLNLKRATTRMEKGQQVFSDKLEMTTEKVAARIKTLEDRYPGFEAIANDYYKFWDNIRQMGVDEGLLSKEAKAALEASEPYYVPQRRQFLRSEKPGRSVTSQSAKPAFSGQKAPIKELNKNGSGRDLIDARKSTIEAVGAWTNAILRNRAMQSIVDAVKRDPEAFKGIAEIVEPPKTKVNLKDVLTDGGQDDFIEALDGDFKDLFSTSKVDGDNIVRAMVKGEPVYVKVGDPEIVKALTSMGPQTSSLLIDTLSAFSNATKRGATGLLAPVFAIKGATMDLAQSAIQARNPVKQAAYSVYAIFSGIGDSLSIPGLRNWAQEYERAGGGYSYALKGEKKLNKSVSNITKFPILSPKNAAKVTGKVLKSPFSVLEGIGNIAENAPRIAASKLELQRLGNEITPKNVRDAMNAGREATVNYSRKGLLSQEIEAIAPYSNAAVQGTRRILVALKNNPVRTAAAIGAIAVAPKMYEYQKFHNDPDYQQIPARERMRNIIVKKNADGSFVKIPMDPAYASFGEMTIEGLRAFKDNDPIAFNGSMDALANAWTPPLLTGLLQGVTKKTGAEGSLAGVANATVFGPASAILSNKSFTGSPIVSGTLEGRSKKYQYDEKTSSIAKKVGEVTGASPMQVDYIIKAYGGDLARLVMPLTSDLGQGNTRNTLLRNFIVDPTFTNTLSEDFYAAKDKLNAAYKDASDLDIKLPTWYNDDLRKALNSSAKGSINKDLSELRAWKKEVTADKTLTSKERTQKIREIQEKINAVYININSILKENGVIK